MIGHSHWSRAHKPFLLCKCKKGDHAEEEAICKMLDDQLYKEKIESSKERFNQQDQISAAREASELDPYNYKAHREWCACFNSGVCHINFVGLAYNISSFWPDVFHGRSGVVKLLVKYIRRMMEGNTRNLTIFYSYLQISSIGIPMSWTHGRQMIPSA